MKQSLIITVERATHQPSTPFKKVFDQKLDIDNALDIPYTSLLCSLKFIYGSDSIISFSIW